MNKYKGAFEWPAMASKRKKKKTAKKRVPRRKAPAKKKRTSWLPRVLILLLVAVLLISGIYFFGSFETRANMERVTLATLNSPRTHGATPAPVSRLLDTLYDVIPSSEGLVVEGGELGRDEASPFIAGMPHSRQAIRLLRQPSYSNLFNERILQTACIAIRLDDSDRQKAKAFEAPQIDGRMPKLTAQGMTLGKWQPQPIAPAKALIGQQGARGASDAQLATNYVPMPEAFATGVWAKVMREFTLRYPERFGEVWIYLGPAYRPESSKLASGIALSDAFYAIAFDLTEEGGLRALALLIPSDAESKSLNDYLTSIAQIEKLTGLQFLPELDFSFRDTLGNYISPSVW
ncbi:MAG: DNA/RNA endonuclease G (NUC1) [Candidatus Azotimanducaceae bacterium]